VFTIGVIATDVNGTVTNTEVEFTVTLECTITLIEVVSGGEIEEVKRVIYREFLQVSIV